MAATDTFAKKWFHEKVASYHGTSMPVLEMKSSSGKMLRIPLTLFLCKPIEAIFIINDMYVPSTVVPENSVSEGRLSLLLTTQMPGVQTPDTVFIHDLSIALVNRVNGAVLFQHSPRSGRNLQFDMAATLDAAACIEYQKILLGIPSGLHVVARYTVFVPALQTFKSLESTQPLSKIIQWSGLVEQMKNSIRYLGMLEVQMLPRQRSLNSTRTQPMMAPARPSFISHAQMIGSNHAVLQPAAAVNAFAIVHSPAIAATALAIKLDNPILTIPAADYPLVSNVEDNWFPNSNGGTLYWAKPAFAIKDPSLNEDPEISPYRFLFRHLGTGLDGKPVLEGEIRLTLQYQIDPATEQSIKQRDPNATIRLIALTNVVMSLNIPFTSQSGEAKTTELMTPELTVNENKTITALFRLTNDWVRICYAVIAAPTSSLRAEVRVAYAFDGVEAVTNIFQAYLINQNLFKIAAVPVLRKTKGKGTRSAASNASYFDLERHVLNLGNGQTISFDGNGLHTRDAVAHPRFGKLGIVNNELKIPATQQGTLLPLADEPRYNQLFANEKILKRTYLQKATLPLHIDCALYGTFYQETRDNVTSSIGCKQPYTLGEVNPALYIAFTQVTSTYFTLYRSTQVPNNFLVLPKRYVITRYEPDREGLAYQPCVRLYSTIDVAHLDRCKCILDATLAPDIPLFEWQELRRQLRQQTPYEPFLSLPGTIEHKEDYQWGISPTLSQQVESFSMGAYIRLNVSTPIEGALTLHALLNESGIGGSVRFTLPDDMVLTTQIVVSLREIQGPFENGPVVITEGTKITFKNPLARSVHLRFMNHYDADGKRTVPIDQTLQPKAQLQLVHPGAGDNILCFAMGDELEQLNESRQYMEDIQCQVIFVTTLDFAQLQINEIVISYGLRDGELSETRLGKDKSTAEELMVMPLTHFLDQREVRYALQVKKTNGNTQIPEVVVSLAENGNIINITADSIKI